jgi:hypothetical protein
MIALWFLAGSAAEVLNTLSRRWSVDHLQGSLWSLVTFVGFWALRLAGTALVLMLAFRHAAVSGLAALVGYLVCRWVVIWWISRGLSPG